MKLKKADIVNKIVYIINDTQEVVKGYSEQLMFVNEKEELQEILNEVVTKVSPIVDIIDASKTGINKVKRETLVDLLEEVETMRSIAVCRCLNASRKHREYEKSLNNDREKQVLASNLNGLKMELQLVKNCSEKTKALEEVVNTLETFKDYPTLVDVETLQLAYDYGKKVLEDIKKGDIVSTVDSNYYIDAYSVQVAEDAKKDNSIIIPKVKGDKKMTKLQLLQAIACNDTKVENILVEKCAELAQAGKLEILREQASKLYTESNPILKIVYNSKTGIKRTSKSDLMQLYRDGKEFLDLLPKYVLQATKNNAQIMHIVDEQLESLAFEQGGLKAEELFWLNDAITPAWIHETILSLGNLLFNGKNLKFAIEYISKEVDVNVVEYYIDNTVLANRDDVNNKLEKFPLRYLLEVDDNKKYSSIEFIGA